MRVQETELAGVFIVKFEKHKSERGFFARSGREEVRDTRSTFESALLERAGRNKRA